MRTALRTPWRTTGFDPATVLRHTARSNFAPLNRLYHFTSSTRSIVLNPKSTSRVQRPLCRPCTPPTSLSSLRKQCYSTSSTVAQEAGNEGRQSGPGQAGNNSNNNKTIKYVVVGGVLGIGAIVYSGEVQHLYHAVTRTGRVVSALAICINECVLVLMD